MLSPSYRVLGFPVALLAAAVASGSIASQTLGHKRLNVRLAPACHAAAWRLQGAGFLRDENFNVIPVDTRPDFSARAARLWRLLRVDEGRASRREIEAANALNESSEGDEIWAATAEASLPVVVQVADQCERALLG